MTTLKRQQEAEKYNLINDIGKKVSNNNDVAFRNHDIAVIIGWSLGIDDRPLYFIKYDNGECDCILAGERFKENGYFFVK
jgi:hypothetical protein